MKTVKIQMRGTGYYFRGPLLHEDSTTLTILDKISGKTTVSKAEIAVRQDWEDNAPGAVQ